MNTIPPIFNINNDNIQEFLNLDKINNNILYQNKLIHILAIRGNNLLFKVVEFYISNNLDLSIGNQIYNNFIHLLIYNGWSNFIYKLFDKYEKYLIDLLVKNNQYNCIPIMYSFFDEQLFYYLCNKMYKYNLIDIFNNSSTFDTNIYTEMLKEINNKYEKSQAHNIYFKIIKKLLNNIDITKPSKYPILIYCILLNLNNISK